MGQQFFGHLNSKNMSQAAYMEILRNNNFSNGSTSVARALAGICVVRNARDLIGLICGHYLRIGLTHIRFVDDGSSDGTYELLCKLADRERRISVRRVNSEKFPQAELTSEQANELLRGGFTTILPFDADEFWNISARALEKRYARHQEITFRGKWVNFVQNQKATEHRPFDFFDIRYRAPNLIDANKDTVTAHERPFVCFAATKIGFKAARPVTLDKGQHSLSVGPTESASEVYEIFHLPFRHKAALVARALDYEPRRAPLRQSPDESWQSWFHNQAVMAGRTDDVWRANSADRDGFLSCNGNRIALSHDNQMRKLLLMGLIYLALRCRMLPL
jgi:hypothetical protein